MPLDKLHSVAGFPELWQTDKRETVVQYMLPNAEARQHYTLYRAIGTCPAGPAAARPTFGQPTCTKMPNFSSLFRVAMLAGRLGRQLSSTRFMLGAGGKIAL